MVASRFALVVLLALLGSGCEEQDCKPCQNTGTQTCPNVQGNLVGDIQISEGSCEVPWGGQGQVSMNVDQSQVNAGEDDEFSKLTIMIVWSAGGLMVLTFEGELCDTGDEEFPKRYPFYASSQDTSDNQNISYSLGAEFIVYDPLEGKNVDYCGAISISVSGGEDTCSMAAVIYSQDNLCD